MGRGANGGVTGGEAKVAFQAEQKDRDLSGYSGTMAEKIQSAITDHAVVMFGKSWCAFTIEVTETLHAMKIPCAAFYVDTMADGSAVHAELKSMTGQKTVPYVYIAGEFIGGCTDFKALIRSNELERKLDGKIRQSFVSGDLESGEVELEAKEAGTPPAPQCLFWFPDTVDNRVVRMVGVMVAILSVLGIVFRKKETMHWVITGLAFDFLMRLMFGAPASVLGMIATTLVAPTKPHFRPGPPKQFASFCGCCFSFGAMILFHCDLELPAAIVLAGLAGAAGMEGFLDFCLGCVFFGWGIQLNLVPKTVYSIYTNMVAENSTNWDEQNARLNEPTPIRETRAYPGYKPSAIDLQYKVKTDDYTREDFHPIRHVTIAHFSSALAMAGLAAVWKTLTGPGPEPFGIHNITYQVISLVAAVWFGILALLYTARAALYPRKVAKEWQHPLMGPAFGVPPICLMLFAMLVADESEDLAEVLFWAGASCSMALACAMLGRWVTERKDDEHINAGWMIPPLSNFVAAMVCPMIAHGKHSEACFFFYSIALLMWVAIFTVTFKAAVTEHNSEDRARPLLFIWVAAPAVASVAWVSMVSANGSPSVAATWDVPSKLMYYMSLCLFLGLSWAFKTNFFGRHKWDMSYWMFVFPLDTLAIASLQYHRVMGSNWSRAIATISVIIASSACAVCLLHMIAALIRRHVFRPDNKWGPLSFMKLTHEALREALPHMVDACSNMKPELDSAASVESFASKWRMLKMVHDEHSTHEDQIIFKQFNSIFPLVAGHWNDDHEKDHHAIEEITGEVSRLSASKDPATRAAIVRDLQDRIPGFVQHLREHLKGEEDHLNPVGRKHVPVRMMRRLVTDVYEITPAERWAEMMPYLVTNLPNMTMRVRFLRAFMWAMPERSQHIGMMVYRGVSPTLWSLLSTEIPEMIPRGLPGWQRFY